MVGSEARVPNTGCRTVASSAATGSVRILWYRLEQNRSLNLRNSPRPKLQLYLAVIASANHSLAQPVFTSQPRYPRIAASSPELSRSSAELSSKKRVLPSPLPGPGPVSSAHPSKFGAFTTRKTTVSRQGIFHGALTLWSRLLGKVCIERTRGTASSSE